MVLSCASNLHVVAVPLRDGAETVTDTSQVQVIHWVDHLKPDLFISPTERIRKMYNLIIDVPVRHLGTRSFGNIYWYTNALIFEIVGITLNADDIAGNMLVVKHV